MMTSDLAGTWSYLYDQEGRYTSMTSPAGTSSASYLDNGWESSRTLPNGVKTSYGYNGVGALTSLLTQTSGLTTLAQYGSFGYDGVFNPTGVTANSPNAGSLSFGYDSHDRLTSDISSRGSGYSNSFLYDSAGNATTLRGSSHSYNADNQISDSGYSFDGNGCPTTYNGVALGYDPEMRMTSYGSNFTAVYRYDGLRAWKQTSSSKTCFYYDGNLPIFETDGSGNLTAINVFAPDGLVAREVNGAWTQYSFDPQGNVDNRLDSSGNVLSIPTFDAYGAGSPGDVFGYNGRWGYYTDSETGLSLLGERYYDSSMGRFVTSDPTGFAGGTNLYSYCYNSPTGIIDPSGLSPVASRASCDGSAEDDEDPASRIAQTAEDTADDPTDYIKSHGKFWSTDCGTFVHYCVHDFDSSYPQKKVSVQVKYLKGKGRKRWTLIRYRVGIAQPGDVLIEGTSHTEISLGGGVSAGASEWSHPPMIHSEYGHRGRPRFTLIARLRKVKAVNNQ